MARQRFVQPESARVSLSDGDWVEFKKRLTVGEQREAFACLVGDISPTGWRRPDVKLIGLEELRIYLVDWSFVDATGKRVPISRDALMSLDTDSYAELEAALAQHKDAMAAALEAEKNVQGSASASAATS